MQSITTQGTTGFSGKFTTVSVGIAEQLVKLDRLRWELVEVARSAADVDQVARTRDAVELPAERARQSRNIL